MSPLLTFIFFYLLLGLWAFRGLEQSISQNRPSNNDDLHDHRSECGMPRPRPIPLIRKINPTADWVAARNDLVLAPCILHLSVYPHSGVLKFCLTAPLVGVTRVTGLERTLDTLDMYQNQRSLRYIICSTLVDSRSRKDRFCGWGLDPQSNQVHTQKAERVFPAEPRHIPPHAWRTSISASTNKVMMLLDLPEYPGRQLLEWLMLYSVLRGREIRYEVR
jgi:hypothetical protein